MFRMKCLIIIMISLAIMNGCALNTSKSQYEDSSIKLVVLEADNIQEIAIPKFVIAYLDSVQQAELRCYLQSIDKISSKPVVDIQKVNHVEEAALRLTPFSYLGFDPLRDLPLQMKNRLFLHFTRLDYANGSHANGSHYEYTSFAWPDEKDKSYFNNLPSNDGPLTLTDSFSNFTTSAGTAKIGDSEKAFLITASDKYYYVPYEYLLYSTRLYCQERQTILGKAISLLKSQKIDELKIFLDECSKIRGGERILGFSLEDSVRIRESRDEVITIELLEDDTGFKLIQ